MLCKVRRERLRPANGAFVLSSTSAPREGNVASSHSLRAPSCRSKSASGASTLDSTTSRNSPGQLLQTQHHSLPLPPPNSSDPKARASVDQSSSPRQQAIRQATLEALSSYSWPSLHAVRSPNAGPVLDVLQRPHRMSSPSAIRVQVAGECQRQRQRPRVSEPRVTDQRHAGASCQRLLCIIAVFSGCPPLDTWRLAIAASVAL